MNPNPNPFDLRAVSRGSLVGLALAVMGIGLFLALWFLLGSAGIADLPRLVVAICAPPAVLTLIVAVYALRARPGIAASATARVSPDDTR